MHRQGLAVLKVNDGPVTEVMHILGVAVVCWIPGADPGICERGCKFVGSFVQCSKLFGNFFVFS